MVLSVLLVISISTVVCGASFKDVSVNHWAYESVNFLAERGIISGMPDGTFQGNQPLTRYQAAVALKRLYELIETGSNRPVSAGFDSQDILARIRNIESLANSALSATEKLGRKVAVFEEQMLQSKTHTESAPESSGKNDQNDVAYEIDNLREKVEKLEQEHNTFTRSISSVENELVFVTDTLERIESDESALREKTFENTDRISELEGRVKTMTWISVGTGLLGIAGMAIGFYALYD